MAQFADQRTREIFITFEHGCCVFLGFLAEGLSKNVERGVLQLDEGAFGRYHELPAGVHCVSRSLRSVVSTFLIIIGSSLPYPSSPALHFSQALNELSNESQII